MTHILETLAVSDKINTLNDYIKACFLSDTTLINEISAHLVHAGGKRLRPAVVFLFAKSLNYQGNSDINAAAIIEFIHTATLLHDDVVDGSLQRRGLKTANAIWGNAPSVLVGDFLYSRAFQLMAKENNLEIFKLLADVTNTIAEGEVEQLTVIGQSGLKESDYYRIIFRKTAVLFSAAAQIGTLIATTDKKSHNAAKDYGKELGMAFQIMDDVLDYTGNSEQTGKNVGDDLREGKLTLPMIKFLEKEPQYKELLENIISFKHESDISRLASLIQKSDVIDYCKDKAKEHATTAKTLLEKFPSNSAKDALHHLADFSVTRTH